MVKRTESADEIMRNLQATIFELRLTGMEIDVLVAALTIWAKTETNTFAQYMYRKIGRKLYEVVR